MAARYPIPTLRLRDGHSIPALGFGIGTAWIDGKKTEINRKLVEAIKTAIKLGYRHFDTAEVYNSERELGIAIKESEVPREEFFVTTKLWKNWDNITASFEASLERLRMDYVDLYLIHSPFFVESSKDLQTQWSSLEALHSTGRARSIGVSNFYAPHLTAILQTAKIKPVINQIELHPYLQHPDLQALLKTHNIALASYGPLTPITKASPGPVDEVVERLARKYGAGEGEILLRWVIEQGGVAITTSSKEERMRGYLKATEFELTEDEVKEISEKGKRKHHREFFRSRF
ncbi:hypothetical protein FGG08_005441 [Glutinoglossum americanum]|uniref:NADP-dependent oxidoreductase domain-containing protein n=1 Tax=Glutinoglossum americanum TaxID=1670608 RepID=A0A9P8KW07_9PEZI|nr:hypothetical protein FGG08_005441 [Glutinoglossum americanum]